MLSPGAGGSVSIDAQIFVLNIYFNVFVDFGIDKKGSKGRMSPRRLIKGRNSNQSVNTGFSGQQPVSILAFNSERYALQSSFLAWLIFENFGLASSLISPLEIHAQAHRGPLLSPGPSGDRWNLRNRVPSIILAGQDHFCFGLADVVCESVE